MIDKKLEINKYDLDIGDYIEVFLESGVEVMKVSSDIYTSDIDYQRHIWVEDLDGGGFDMKFDSITWRKTGVYKANFSPEFLQYVNEKRMFELLELPEQKREIFMRMMWGVWLKSSIVEVERFQEKLTQTTRDMINGLTSPMG